MRPHIIHIEDFKSFAPTINFASTTGRGKSIVGVVTLEGDDCKAVVRFHVKDRDLAIDPKDQDVLVTESLTEAIDKYNELG